MSKCVIVIYCFATVQLREKEVNTLNESKAMAMVFFPCCCLQKDRRHDSSSFLQLLLPKSGAL
jgi:hypothetical protein